MEEKQAYWTYSDVEEHINYIKSQCDVFTDKSSNFIVSTLESKCNPEEWKNRIYPNIISPWLDSIKLRSGE